MACACACACALWPLPAQCGRGLSLRAVRSGGGSGCIQGCGTRLPVQGLHVHVHVLPRAHGVPWRERRWGPPHTPALL